MATHMHFWLGSVTPALLCSLWYQLCWLMVWHPHFNKASSVAGVLSAGKLGAKWVKGKGPRTQEVDTANL